MLAIRESSNQPPTNSHLEDQPTQRLIQPEGSQGPDSAISLTQFFPFVLADSIGKRSEVRSIKRTHGLYTPAIDYWRLLRLQVVAFHQYGAGPGLDALDTAVELAHDSRRENYRQCVINYRRLLGRKQIDFIGEPRRGMWLAEGLQVRINPELHLSMNGTPRVVKLYFKTGKRHRLTQRTANPMLHLLDECHGHLGAPMVFDVFNGRAFSKTRVDVDFDPMLRAQAAAFVSLWQADPTPGLDQPKKEQKRVKETTDASHQSAA